MRTTKVADSYKHLQNSLDIFKALEKKAHRFDYIGRRFVAHFSRSWAIKLASST